MYSSCIYKYQFSCSAVSITNTRRVLKFMSIKSVMSSNHFVLCRPLLLQPSIFPSIRVFSNESVLCIRWPKSWNFSFSISPSNEYSWLISFKIDWFDLLAVQGNLKSLLQHHSSKASVLQCSAFMFQLSHPYVAIGKTMVRLQKSKYPERKLLSCLISSPTPAWTSQGNSDQVGLWF